MATSAVDLHKLMALNNEKPTQRQQIRILHCILEDAKQAIDSTQDALIQQLITDCQKKIKEDPLPSNKHDFENDKEPLNSAIEHVNKLIVILEQKKHGQPVLDYLKKHGVYRILYRNARVQGQQLPSDDVLNELLRAGFWGIGISAVIIAFFITITLIGAPVWLTAISAGLFTGASTYLSGIAYGVVNDLFATHTNLPYFLLGHQFQQTSMLRTNDKIAQGVTWGIAATFGPVFLASILFTLIATVTAFFVPLAIFVLPVMMMAMPLIAVGAEKYAQKKTQEYLDSSFFQLEMIGSNLYQEEGLKFMCPTQETRASWLSTSDRNVFGFTKVPLIGVGGLIGFMALSMFSAALPPVLFASPIIAMAIPAAFAGFTCLSLITAGVYAHVNRNTQLDDRYRLQFEGELNPNLYLEEDRDYVQTILNRYPDPETKNDSSTDEPVEVEHFSPVLQKTPVAENPIMERNEHTANTVLVP